MKNLKPLPTVLLAISCLLLSSIHSFAQNVGINTTGAVPDNSALLDLDAPDKGFLITRADTANIPSPAFGLMTLAPLDTCLYLYNGIKWMGLGGGGSDCSCSNVVGAPSTGNPPSNCGPSFSITDARDNQTYGTVSIGNQCWLSENVNYTPTSGNSWCYDNDPANCIIYGRLYDWNTASNNTTSVANPSGVQGVCPTGWHLPSDLEWKELELAIGMSPANANNIGWRGPNEGDALKATTWGGGNNSSGFTALPAGHRFDNGPFGGIIEGTIWWSATAETGVEKWRRDLGFDQTGVYRYHITEAFGLSVRCVRD